MCEEGQAEGSVWSRREATRMRQINIGKARPEYRRYVAEVPCDARTPSQPATPDHRARVSKRQFDRDLSAWRRQLHEWESAPQLPGMAHRHGAGEGSDASPYASPFAASVQQPWLARKAASGAVSGAAGSAAFPEASPQRGASRRRGGAARRGESVVRLCLAEGLHEKNRAAPAACPRRVGLVVDSPQPGALAWHPRLGSPFLPDPATPSPGGLQAGIFGLTSPSDQPSPDRTPMPPQFGWCPSIIWSPQVAHAQQTGSTPRKDGAHSRCDLGSTATPLFGRHSGSECPQRFGTKVVAESEREGVAGEAAAPSPAALRKSTAFAELCTPPRTPTPPKATRRAPPPLSDEGPFSVGESTRSPCSLRTPLTSTTKTPTHGLCWAATPSPTRLYRPAHEAAPGPLTMTAQPMAPAPLPLALPHALPHAMPQATPQALLPAPQQASAGTAAGACAWAPWCLTVALPAPYGA